jgi:hypothetical protein
MRMLHADDYRRYADHCVRVALEVANPGDKALLLQMAQRWRELAEKAQKAPGPNGHRGA